MFAPFVVQLDPVAAVPPLQLQVFAKQEFELKRYPALQEAQIAPPWLVQLAPVAALPLVQVHVFASHSLSVESNVYPASQLEQIFDP